MQTPRPSEQASEDIRPGIWGRFVNGALMAFHAVIFVLAIVLVVSAVSVIAQREHSFQVSRSAISEIQAILAEKTSAGSESTKIDAVLQSEIEALRLLLRTKQLQEENAHLAIARGQQDASTGQSWRELLRPFVTDEHGLPNKIIQVLLVVWAFIAEEMPSVSGLSSERLLAIVVIGSGAIGAMLIHFRQNQSIRTSAFLIGLGSGFLALLALKGGHQIFALGSSSTVVIFNPYSSALAGVIAGLFSDKLFSALSIFADELSRKLASPSSESTSQTSASGSSTQSRETKP